MSGLIATSCRPQMARWTAFYKMRDRLLRPEGAVSRTYEGFWSHQNKNAAVREALAEDRPWIFFLDDDQILEEDALVRLLAHDTDIVTCNLLTKEPPFQPFIFFATDARGAGHADSLTTQRGLQEVAAAGLGGVLVKTDVFRHIPEPWFDVDDYLKTEDMWFHHQAMQAGYRIYCDFDVVSGHIGLMVIYPRWNAQSSIWQTKIAFTEEQYVVIDAAKPSPEYEAWKEGAKKRLAASQAP